MSIESLYAFFSRHPRKKIAITSIVLLAALLFAGWQFTAKVKEVVTDEFNQQQLELARHAADQVSHTVLMLRKELALLSLSPSVQYFEKSFLAHRLQITFSSLQEKGVFEILYIDATGLKTHHTSNEGYKIQFTDPLDHRYFLWAKDDLHRSAVMASEVYPIVHGKEYQKLVMKIAIPVWKTSVDDAHPLPANTFSGVLIASIDVTELIKRLTVKIKSGKTGYAWVIDSNGTFLYHIEKELIGKNAFEARKEKKPTISFARINEIQKKLMLTGKEGTSWYISGWHRGEVGMMKKLIAYSPIILDGMGEKRIWSVAVVAPISEVEGAIHDIQVRQFIMLAASFLIIFTGSLLIISLLAKWSTLLKQEVAWQTEGYRRSEQRYRSLVEHAEDLIFTLSPNGVFLSINSYGAKFLKRSPAEIVGLNIAEIFLSETAESILATIRDVVAMKRGTQITHLMRFNSEERWVNTNYRRLLNEDGSVYAILGISRDITERKKMEEQNYNTEKMASLGTLAAGVAHEINNPLAIILGFTDLLKGDIAKNTEAYEILSVIERQGLKAKRVVENLLTFSRRRDPTHSEVDVNECIKDVLTILGNSILLNRISIKEVALSPTLPKVAGDPDELEQVFFNILNNAIYAMKSTGGALSISTREGDDGKSVEITISDTGPGIAREHRSRIFDPLFTTKKVGEGTGLGLSVTYGIISRHRGIITFDTATRSESKNTGTTFYITLPAVIPNAIPDETAHADTTQ